MEANLLIVRRFALQVVGLVFPILCVGCGIEGAWLCSSCAATTLPRITSRPGSGALDRVVALYPYRDLRVRKLVTEYKYRGGWTALPALQSLIRRALSPSLMPAVDVIAPLPLHRFRLHERGYNQAAGLARAVADVLDAPLYPDLLMRARRGGQQAKKSDDDRRTPFKPDTFLVVEPGAARGTRILLVDDVFTTGVTMTAAADALRRLGAASVTGFALAYGG